METFTKEIANTLTHSHQIVSANVMALRLRDTNTSSQEEGQCNAELGVAEAKAQHGKEEASVCVPGRVTISPRQRIPKSLFRLCWSLVLEKVSFASSVPCAFWPMLENTINTPENKQTGIK